MNGDRLDPRKWRNIVSYLAGMGVEALLTGLLGAIAVLLVVGLGLLAR